MAKSTKLKSTSRFGSRYSTPLKNVVRDIEEVQKKKQQCPQCGKVSLKRKGYSRWECSKCGAVIAGGSYVPKTEVGGLVQKIVSRTISNTERTAIEQQIEKAQIEEKGEEVEE